MSPHEEFSSSNENIFVKCLCQPKACALKNYLCWLWFLLCLWSLWFRNPLVQPQAFKHSHLGFPKGPQMNIWKPLIDDIEWCYKQHNCHSFGRLSSKHFLVCFQWNSVCHTCDWQTYLAMVLTKSRDTRHLYLGASIWSEAELAASSCRLTREVTWKRGATLVILRKTAW